jgi:hypothetical protein
MLRQELSAQRVTRLRGNEVILSLVFPASWIAGQACGRANSLHALNGYGSKSRQWNRLYAAETERRVTLTPVSYRLLKFLPLRFAHD